MVKIMGILMIIGSSGFLGSYIYRMLKNRCEILKEMLAATDILQAEIVFKRANLIDATNSIARRVKGYASEFWKEVHKNIKNNESIAKAFEKGFETIKHKGITKEDIEVINTLAGVLGKYDTLEQAQMVKNIRELINMQWTESNRELKERGRLYRALGLSFGIVIALVVI